MAQALTQHVADTALAGFGRASWTKSHVVAIEHVEQLQEVFERCRAQRTHLTFRGAGRSYGDAAVLAGGSVIDMTRLSRILAWDAQTGIIECEPGVTIEALWRRVLPDGYWPAVVPGTMRPTLGGCLAMNIHGKNNFRMGPIGDHVLDFDLLTIQGQLLRCSRLENAELFHAAIAGLGLLGAITRIRLQTKRIESHYLAVRVATASSLDGMFELFQARLPGADYLVGWVDCTARGRGLGRGVTHDANYLKREKDPLAAEAQPPKQDLPAHVFGLPKRLLPTLLRPFANNLGTRLINSAKYHHARLTDSDRPFFQSHVEFAFLLDFIPNWDRGLAPHGLVQFQVFAPQAEAARVFRKVLSKSIEQGLPAYLGVMKRHRPDAFLLSHALDGYSLALDYRVPPGDRAPLHRLLRELTDVVLDSGGKFYFAKDSILNADDAVRAYGSETLKRFFEHKQALDPNGLLESELSRRVFCGLY